MKGGLASSLHSDLYSALNTVAAYEVQSTGESSFINNSAYVLQTLMMNGTIYGSNSIGGSVVMNEITLSSYTNSLLLLAKQEGLNLTITNATLQIYQNNPYSINATYSLLQ